MKIVNIILTSQNGGAEQVFVDYSAILKKLGHDVLAIVNVDAPYAENVSNLGIEVKKIKNSFGYHDYFAIKNIQKILQEFDADAVIAHVGRSIALSRKATRKIKNKKVLLVAVNHSMNAKRSVGADLILSVNKEIFYKTIELGQAESASFVVPNAIDLSDAITTASKVNLQEKETIVIGGIGRLDKGKSFDLSIRAIAELEKISNKKFILKIAGSGEQEPYLKGLAKDLNLENKIEFLGWIKNKKEFFESIDILCMPSQNETFGLVLLEAIKFRKPIISTKTDGAKEILRHEIDGLLIDLEPRDQTPKRIADAVIEMIDEPQMLNSMLENSFARLKTKFSTEALENVFKEIVGVGKNK
jgi:glycosyltransferase involved in cell wall biosynthesis